MKNLNLKKLIPRLSKEEKAKLMIESINSSHEHKNGPSILTSEDREFLWQDAIERRQADYISNIGKLHNAQIHYFSDLQTQYLVFKLHLQNFELLISMLFLWTMQSEKEEGLTILVGSNAEEQDRFKLALKGKIEAINQSLKDYQVSLLYVVETDKLAGFRLLPSDIYQTIDDYNQTVQEFVNMQGVSGIFTDMLKVTKDKKDHAWSDVHRHLTRFTHKEVLTSEEIVTFKSKIRENLSLRGYKSIHA